MEKEILQKFKCQYDTVLQNLYLAVQIGVPVITDTWHIGV
jgi:hypothetical protein